MSFEARTTGGPRELAALKAMDIAKLALAVAILPIAVAAQQPLRTPSSSLAVLYGSVLSDLNDRPVADAEVIVSAKYGAHTNAAGDFIIRGIAPGQYVVTVRHLGHAAITTTLNFSAGDSLGRDFVLSPEVATLDTTRVRAGYVPPSAIALGKMAGYADRRHRHIGLALDSTVLNHESYRPLGDLLRAHLPVNLLSIGSGAAIASPRGMVMALSPTGPPSGDVADRRRGARPACYSQVYLDGMRVYAPAPDVKLFDLNQIDPTRLQAVEFFPGPAETPGVYGGTGASCGTLLLWTKTK